MWLNNYGRIVLFFTSVATANLLQSGKCVYFESESGFIKLLDLPSFKENSIISMEVKAYNCDTISIVLHNGENYKLIISDPIFRKSFDIFSSCIGLWHEVTVELRKSQPLLKFGSQRIYTHTARYEFDAFRHAFDDHALYLGVYPRNDNDYETRYNKTFKGFIRNIKIDDQSKAIDSLNGTLIIRDCPMDFRFGSNGGALLVNDEFHVNDDILIYFELKVAATDDCNALIMSAHSEHSYLIVEIVNNILYMKMKAGNTSEKVGLYSYTEVPLCDGKWHKIALRKYDDYASITSDATSYGTNDFVSLNFTSSLYVGQHPDMQEILAIQSPNSFIGCLRGLHINGIVTDVSGNFLLGDSQISICST